MPVRPTPFKVICPICGGQDIFAPRSDAFPLPSCPSCHTRMELHGKATNLGWVKHAKHILQKLIKSF